MIWHDHVNRDWRDAFRLITMPVMILMGTKSHYVSEKLWDWLKQMCPQAVFHTLEGGHGAHLECPDVFCTLVKDFLLAGQDSAAVSGISESDREMKNKYAVDALYAAVGKTVAIIGAGGNWGAHLAVGMALTSGCNVVLVDSSVRKEAVERVAEDLRASGAEGTVSVVCLDQVPETYDELAAMVGPFDSVMDVRHINREESNRPY
ncbi:MAG: hypothetical protein IKD69_12150 [Solobacterium sp.]|nr:hypothetical protein [Solobacterium sp.]